MQLDKTKISIRQRTLLETFDLSLLLIREYWKPILFWSFAGAAPMMILNLIVLWPLLQYESFLLQSSYEWNEGWLRFRYLFHSSVLVFLESPLAMLGTTFYLGQAVFVEKPSTREVLRAIRNRLWSSVLVLGLFRGGLLGLPLLLLLWPEGRYSATVEILLIGFVLLGIVGALRASRPFAPEIMILEQCPLKSPKNKSGMSYSKRSYSLHTPLASDLIGRFLLAFMLFAITLPILMFGEAFLINVSTDSMVWNWWYDLILTPINLWLIATWATVFRFLSYIDSRIRLEGWEIDLRLRAEAERLEAAA
jgi:hypothetical protein